MQLLCYLLIFGQHRLVHEENKDFWQNAGIRNIDLAQKLNLVAMCLQDYDT